MASQPMPGIRMTADELIELPEGEKFYELVRGVLRVREPAGGQHGLISGRLFVQLSSYVEAHGLGTAFPGNTGYFLGRTPDTVRAPDVSFVDKARLSLENVGAGFIALAPDLAVEVVSPNDRASELEEKLADYWAASVCGVDHSPDHADRDRARARRYLSHPARGGRPRRRRRRPGVPLRADGAVRGSPEREQMSREQERPRREDRSAGAVPAPCSLLSAPTA